MTKYQILMVIHIACTAVWFGGFISIPGRLRRGLKAGGAEAKCLVAETGRSLKLSLVFGALTFITGLVLVFYFGGFAKVPKTIHMGMGLVLLMLILEALNRVTFGALAKEVEAGNESRVGSLKARLAMSLGFEQLLWIVVLALMILKSTES
jgi:hypothetical protein